MGIISLVKVGVKSFIGQLGRSSVATLGIILAISFVIGGSLAVDSTVRDTLESILDEACSEDRTCSDFMGYGQTNNSSNSIEISDALRNVSHVIQVEPSLGLPIADLKVWDKNITVMLFLKGTRSTFFSTLVDTPIYGDISLQRGDIVIPTVVAEFLDVEIGETVYYENGYQNESSMQWETVTMNFTLRGTFGEVGEFPLREWAPLTYFTDYPHAYGIVNVSDADWILDELKFDRSGYFQHLYLIHMDRDEVIDPYDIKATLRDMQRIKFNLNNVAYPYGIEVHNEIEQYLREFDMIITGQRVLFLVLSIPILLLGLYVGFIGFSLQEKSRRREIATMIARGASRQHVVLMFVSQGILQGALAGLFGLLLGLFMSRVIIAEVFSQSSALASLGITPLSVFLSILFGIILVFVATYASVRGIWKEQASPVMKDAPRTLREYEYKPNLDIALLVLSISALVLSIPGILGSSLSFFLGVLVIFFAPISPFLLVFSLTRLSTRFSDRPLRAVSRATKPFTRRLWRLVHRNLSRERRRSSSLCIFVTLCIFFGIMASMLAGIQYSYDERVVRAFTGGDILLESNQWDENFTGNLSEIEGVKAVTPIVWLSCDRTSVAAIDPESYLNAVHLEDYYFVDAGPRETIEKLRVKGDAIVSVEESERLGLGVGDTLVVGVYSFIEGVGSELNYYAFRIVGLVKFLPLRAYFSETYVDTAFVISLDSLEPSRREYEIAHSYYYVHIMKVEKGYKDTEVAKELFGMGKAITNLNVYSEILEERREAPLSKGIVNFLSIQAMFAAILVAVGLDVVLLSSYLERRDEFATMGARGMKRRQLAAILFGEGSSILLLSLIIGIATGIIGAISYDQFSAAGRDLVLPRPIVFPLDSVLFVFLSIASVLIAVSIVVIWVSRMSLPSVLRTRGG